MIGPRARRTPARSGRRESRMGVGIRALHPYVGRMSVDIRSLYEARGHDMSRFGNLMMRRKSVNMPFEDSVTNAVNAALPLIRRLTPAERDRVEAVVVATESGVDLGKSLSTYVHRYLELGPRCRSFEVKQACYGGTAALHTAAGMVHASPYDDALALVVAADAAGVPALGEQWEGAEGAGAVAMLVGRDATALELDLGASGCHTFEVMDTFRPGPGIDIVNQDVSMLAYLECLQHSFEAYRDRVDGADIVDGFGYLAFHTPFVGMVRGAHRRLLRQQRKAGRDEVDVDYEHRVRPSMEYGAEVGNIFSASLYLALCSLIRHGDFTEPRRIGLFSYGSGCASEFFSGVVHPRAVHDLAALGVEEALTARRPLTVAEYDTVAAAGDRAQFGVRDARFDLDSYGELGKEFTGRGLLVLERIDGYHRQYRWT
ncbi:hydroxymethylglutaryl-CoA synthase [Streptomyces sp. NPDC006984]|uniref:hydroxymethylglutaryl-CoA synthase family protein n=1 Tax=Streptomyces sp. NPDC006984 TaxID=3155463 RepID=UPI0033EC2300